MTEALEPIYLLGFGQSNMVGGADAGLNPKNWDNTAPLPDITIWNPATGLWEIARIDPGFPDSTSLSRGTSLAWHTAILLHERTGQPVRMIVDAHGGQPIDGAGSQNTGWIGAGEQSVYFQSLVAIMDDADVPRIDLAIFAQGEANHDDAPAWRTQYSDGPSYSAAVSQLLDQLYRQRWFGPDTPFVMPELVPGSDNEDRNDVILALNGDGNPFTDTAFGTEPFRPLPEIGPSGVHWTVRGTPEMAVRIVEAYERIVVDTIYDPFAFYDVVAADDLSVAAPDRVDYSGAPVAVTLNLTNGIGTGWADRQDLQGVVGVRATAFDDYIHANAGFNRIDGGQGHDTILGLGGRDWLRGGSGDDSLVGGAASDILQGGIGDDMLYGGQGFDVLRGDAGNDLLFGGDGFDTLSGDAGDDALYGQAGDDILHGGLGDDHIEGGIGADQLFGGPGSDAIFGGAGEDTIFSGADDDNASGGAGDDRLYGQTGADMLYGGIGNDYIEGNDGDDSVFGGNGADLLLGGDGDDQLFGNAGADTLDGGAGNDLLRGGTGVDTFVFRAGFGQDTIVDFQNNLDVIQIDRALLPQAMPVPDDLRAFASLNANGHLVLSFDANTSLTFNNVTNAGAILDEVVLI